MTEKNRQVRHLAKELAGIFYEQTTQALSHEQAVEWYGPFKAAERAKERNERSHRFRKAFPTVRDYMRGHQHMPDGSIVYAEPGWKHFVQKAQAMLLHMLDPSNNSVSEHMKEQIYEEWLDAHARATDPRSNRHQVTQRMN